MCTTNPLHYLPNISKSSMLFITYYESVVARNLLTLRSNFERYSCSRGDPGALPASMQESSMGPGLSTIYGVKRLTLSHVCIPIWCLTSAGGDMVHIFQICPWPFLLFVPHKLSWMWPSQHRHICQHNHWWLSLEQSYGRKGEAGEHTTTDRHYRSRLQKFNLTSKGISPLNKRGPGQRSALQARSLLDCKLISPPFLF